MYIHGKIENSHVNGPGDRAVIWFQGCHGMNCPGCWNQESHKHGAGSLETANDLVGWLEKQPNIEGITISGGEPLQQAVSLLAFTYQVRERLPYLSIGLYTGYTLKELEDGRFFWYWGESVADNTSPHDEFVPGTPTLWKQIRDNLDFAVMGRYNQLLRTTSKPLCGSSNQELVLFTSFYKPEDFEQQSVEICISPDGKLVNITGFPIQPAALKELCA